MIRLFFLRTIGIIFLSSTFLIAAQDDQTDDVGADSKTPLRPVPITDVEPTPGQQLCQRQATILTRKNFISVLEPKIVDSWGVNWAVFQDESLPFEHPYRIQAIRTINNQLINLLRTNSGEAFINLFGQFSTIRAQIEVVHVDRLDNLALAYFSKLFPSASLTSKTKLGGVQLGERIIVAQAGQPLLTYHVKTHSAGRLSSNSTAAKLVNPQELMGYRVLQYLGVGCESHFFERSPEDVYIATLDAGVGGFFCLFDVMSGHLGRGGDESVGRHFAGSLMDINQDRARHNHDVIEQTVEEDPVAQNFVHQMVSLDIITRIFRLHDLLNNPGNFGFFESTTQIPAIRVIDFRIMDREIFEMDWRDFGGFLVGNGFYQYAGSHKTMRYVIHDRQRQLRVEAARSIMKKRLMELLRRAVEQAHQDVLVYLSQDVFVPCHKDIMPKIHEYYQASLHNINFFWEELQKWTPEADAAREAEHAKYRRGSTGQ